MKTFRRDKLKRLIEAGRVVTVDTYHYDDMTGESRSHTERPVGLTKSGPDEWKNRKEGTCYLFPHDFISKSGTCYEAGTHQATGDPLVTLIVHGNSNYTFRILPEGAVDK
jgi:hypothetical protein